MLSLSVLGFGLVAAGGALLWVHERSFLDALFAFVAGAVCVMAAVRAP